MKKVILLFTTALLVSSGAVYAQSEIDAYRYAQSDLSGTARYVSMAGAFGALGGDISAMSSNPGGLAIYRSSEIVGTLGLNVFDTKTNWTGIEAKDSKTRFNFDNIAYVGYFPTANESGIVGWNVGFSYNRAKNFNRRYKAYGGNIGNSISDYLAAQTSRAMIGNQLPFRDLQWVKDQYDPYNNGQIPWLSTLAFEGGLIVPNKNNPDFIGAYDSSMDGYVSSADLLVNERGGIDKYNFSFATNISNIVFVGATVAVTDLNYHISTAYSEKFTSGDDLTWDNELKTEGTGYGFNLGIIVRPTDYLRLGVAYNSKTWYKMTDYYYADASSYVNDPSIPAAQRTLTASTPTDGAWDYDYSSPDKWIFSAAAILGQSALLSVDYEISNYGNMKLSYADDIDPYYTNGLPYVPGSEMTATNQDIRDHFGVSRTLRVGAEVKVTPQFAVRAGGAWATSPMKSILKNGETSEVFTAGTLTSYAVDKGTTSYYTIGLGYRFTPNFYADLACVFKNYKEMVYPFSPVPESKINPVVVNNVIPASLKNNATKVVLTLGYKF